jgi:RNA polymerase sigma-70 factor, ECF subfamily
MTAAEGFGAGGETVCARSRLIQEWAPRVDHDERELVRRCLQGDQDACASLVQEYAQMVGTVIWRATGDHDAVEDLAQETFLRVFRGLHYFDARAKLSTWIYTIAHRVAIDHLRQVRLKPDTTNVREPSASDPTSVVSGFSRTAVAPGCNPETAAIHEELDAIVREQLHALPEKYRLPLVYATLNELDYHTIGAMLKVQPGTVKTLVFRARQLLRERVESVLAKRRERTHAT